MERFGIIKITIFTIAYILFSVFLRLTQLLSIKIIILQLLFTVTIVMIFYFKLLTRFTKYFNTTYGWEVYKSKIRDMYNVNIDSDKTYINTYKTKLWYWYTLNDSKFIELKSRSNMYKLIILINVIGTVINAMLIIYNSN